MINNFVLYIWWDAEIPFYVGIGRPGRELQWRKRNPHCHAKRVSCENKGTFRVTLEVTDISWELACKLEKQKIAEIGRIIDGGPLTNYAEGGEGGNTTSGWSEGRKQKFIEKMKKVNSSRPKSSYDGCKETIWVTDGINNKRVHNLDQAPEGWEKGRSKGSNGETTYWITNGEINIQVPVKDPVPLNLGWRHGLTQTHHRGKSLKG